VAATQWRRCTGIATGISPSTFLSAPSPSESLGRPSLGMKLEVMVSRLIQGPTPPVLGIGKVIRLAKILLFWTASSLHVV